MFLLFRPINKLNLTLSNIKLNEYLLTLAKSVAYLGIEIDETLFWNNQIKVVAKKLSKTNGTLLKLRYTFQRKIWHKFTAAFSSRTFYNILKLIHLYYNNQSPLKLKDILTANESVNLKIPEVQSCLSYLRLIQLIMI